MIERAVIADAKLLADLHQEAINEGFLSKLGLSFLTSLYRFIICSEQVFVYRDQGLIVGFISFSVDVKGLLRRFFFFSPISVIEIFYIMFQRPVLFFPVLETAKATFHSFFKNKQKVIGPALPKAELLSLAVNPLNQQNGIGARLLYTLEEYLISTKVLEYKVIVGEGLENANKFYVKHGFSFSSKIKIHGQNISVVYIKCLNCEII